MSMALHAWAWETTMQRVTITLDDDLIAAAGSRNCVATLVYETPDPEDSRPSRPVAGDATRASRSRKLPGGDGVQRPQLGGAIVRTPRHCRARRPAWTRRLCADARRT